MKSNTMKWKRRFLILLLVIILVLIFIYWQNNDITITRITYTNKKIDNEFNGYKIAQISDLHNKEFGNKESGLLKKLRETNPDMIVITGDLIDANKNRTNINTAMEFINGAIEIAPIYYVSGNHEKWSGVYDILSEKLTKAGVHVLEDKLVRINKGNSYITLIGLQDPEFIMNDGFNSNDAKNVNERLEVLLSNEDSSTTLNILLCHRPELFKVYERNKIDLSFTGHAHGGQFRIPYVLGVFAPNQGFFPKYTSGAYKDSSSTMIVSRGLGNSTIPIRIFNRPEIVVVTLKSLK